MVDANTLGLALSVGGSRAAAFHCGTVAALEELNLLEKVNVVSAVSGGRVLCHGLTLEKLPVKPILCLNTSVLMRSATVLETERSWMAERIAGATAATLPDIVRDLEGDDLARPRRRLFFVRVNQDWDSMLERVPAWRLRELSHSTNTTLPAPADARAVEAFLQRNTDVDLAPARAVYEKLGKEISIAELNRVPTGFTGLAERQVHGLATHARWQLLVQHALYGAEPGKAPVQEQQATGGEGMK